MPPTFSNPINLTSGDDTYQISGSSQQLNALAGNDTIQTATMFGIRLFSADSELNGGDGDDLFDLFSAMNDTLNGGTGDDTYVLTDSSNCTIIDTGGHNIVRLENSSLFRVNSWGQTEIQTDDGDLDLSHIGADLDGTLLGLADSNLIGSHGTFKGNSGANHILALHGGTLIGNGGADTLEGGSDNNTYVLDNTQQVIVNTGTGTDVVQSASIDLDLTQWSSIENATLSGSANLNITGNGLDNLLWGSAGQNSISGGDGNDSIVGGYPNAAGAVGGDALSGDAGNDDLVTMDSHSELYGGVGDDFLRSLTDTQWIAQNIPAAQADNFTATGNLLDAGSGNDLLWVEGSRDDLLLGGTGNDSLVAVSGVADTLNGGVDDDSLWSRGTNVLLGDAGDDQLISASGHQSLDGGAGDDTLCGDQTDVLQGGAGNDVIFLTDPIAPISAAPANVISAAHDGIDVVISLNLSVDISRWIGIENATLLDVAPTLYSPFGGTPGKSALNLSLTGNALSNILTGDSKNNQISGADGADTLLGNAGNDLLNGGAGDDSLDGGPGNDFFYGGLGSDHFAGGLGDDNFWINSLGDTVNEVGKSGTDTVRSMALSLDLAHYANVERAELLGTRNLNLTGASRSDTLLGNAGANAITGHAGNDVLNGAAGNDQLNGSQGDDMLYGGDGADRLRGGVGADRLTGGSGHDVYVFATAAEAGILTAADVITGFSHLVDDIDLSGFMAGGRFIAAAAFSGHTNEVRYVLATGTLSGDVNGDQVQDWSLTIQNKSTLTAADFIF